jgi:hypothetical protein
MDAMAEIISPRDWHHQEGNSKMTILIVGKGQTYSTIHAAIAASHDGDVIQVQAGIYKNDFAKITDSITLEAVGGRVYMEATKPPPDKKGILTIGSSTTAPNVSITGFSFSGAHIPAHSGGNGAGIRYQSGNLTLSQDWFYNNQDGLLATPFVTGAGSISIDRSEFGFNGTNTGFTHNIYVGMIGSFTITNSYIHDAKGGHEIKSRAQANDIENNRIFDNNSTASYSIDLPNGGLDTVSNNLIEKGLNSATSKMVAFLEAPGAGSPNAGSDTGHWSNSSLTMNGNIFINDRSSSNVAALWNADTLPVVPGVSGSALWNVASGSAFAGPADISGTTWLTARPTLSTAHPWS